MQFDKELHYETSTMMDDELMFSTRDWQHLYSYIVIPLSRCGEGQTPDVSYSYSGI